MGKWPYPLTAEHRLNAYSLSRVITLRPLPEGSINPADISDARLHYIFIEQAYPLKGFGDSKGYKEIRRLRHGAETEISEIGNSQYNRVYMVIRRLRHGVGGGEILRIGNSQVGKDYILSVLR